MVVLKLQFNTTTMLSHLHRRFSLFLAAVLLKRSMAFTIPVTWVEFRDIEHHTPPPKLSRLHSRQSRDVGRPNLSHNMSNE